MRFCVSCRQGSSVINEAQEIKVDYRDIAFVDEYIEKEEKPHTIIIRLPKYETINWDLLVMYDDKLGGNLLLALDDITLAPEAKAKNLKFYWNFPVSTHYELENLKALGVSQVILGMPLIFDYDIIKQKEIKVRLIPNYAFNEYLIDDDGVCAGWIRPEDLALYEEIAESCEFYTDSLKKEKAMLHIYSKGDWPDDLSIIINGLNKEFNNQYLRNGFGERRLNCKQVCKRDSQRCHFCERIRKTSVNLKYINDSKKKSNIDL